MATVLPSLPEIVGVVDQGGDGYGAAQAFAGAGRKEPIIIMGNRQDELAWWKEQKAKNGYTTWSASIAPGVSTLAFWVAQQILDGRKDIPHDLLVPYLAFTQDDFEAALPNIPVGGVASHEYTQEDAKKAIEANYEESSGKRVGGSAYARHRPRRDRLVILAHQREVLLSRRRRERRYVFPVMSVLREHCQAWPASKSISAPSARLQGLISRSMPESASGWSGITAPANRR